MRGDTTQSMLDREMLGHAYENTLEQGIAKDTYEKLLVAVANAPPYSSLQTLRN